MSISAGVYTVGPNRDYADWRAAQLDLAAALTGDLYLLQLGELTQTVDATFLVDLNGHNLILTCPFPHKGHPSSGMKTIFDLAGDALDFQVTDSAGGGSVSVGHLYGERASGAGSAATDALIRVPAAAASAIPHYFHDLLLVSDGENGVGIRLSTRRIHSVWNVKGQGFVDGALVSVEDNEDHAADLRIENCTARDCYYGFRVEPSTVSIGKFLNCVAFDSNSADFEVNSGQAGSGNISEDGTASAFTGTNNLYDYDGVTNSPAVSAEFKSLALSNWWLRIDDDATVLPFNGVASEIDDSVSALRLTPKANAAGAEGNSRPGSDGQYSRGADEYREVFPNAWTRRARVQIDPAWVDDVDDPPILIRYNTPGLPSDFRTSVKAYGDDIRITTDPEGQNQIPVEIHRFDVDDDDFNIWTAADLDIDKFTPLYVWWGNPNASQIPYRGANPDGAYRVWNGAALILHMGNEFGALTWCKDSSGYHRHPWIENLANWYYSSQTRGRRAGMVSTTRFNLQEVDQPASGPPLQQSWGMSGFAIAQSATTPHVDSIIEAVRSGVQRFSMKLNERLLELDARAPDANPALNLKGTTNLGTGTHRLSAVADIYPDRMRLFVDGQTEADEAKAFTNNYTDATVLTSLTVGEEVSSANGFSGSLEEVRLWNKTTPNAWVKVVHENLHYATTLFSGYSGGACMNGVRNFTFTVPGSGPFKLSNTDFWLSYEDDGAGGLTLRLNGIWDKICPATEIGLARRVELERVVRELSEWFAGLRGTLLLDEGLDSEFTLERAKLLTVDWEVIDNNAGLLYTLEFGLNLGIAGTQFSRMLVFGIKALAADNLIVTVVGRDQTQFKPVFRAAPVRIPGGPPIKRVQVAAIVQGLGPGGIAQRRRQAETIIRDWVDTYLGEEAQLTIDGQGYGMAHLAAVRSGTVELPEAAGFDLEFAIEYGS